MVAKQEKCFIVLESREGYREHPVVEATVKGKHKNVDFLYHLSFTIEGKEINTLRAKGRIFKSYQKGFLARTELYSRYGHQN